MWKDEELLRMRIKRYCGRERLPRGERYWRRLAKTAGFDGTVSIYGFGVRGEVGHQHVAMATGRATEAEITWGDFGPGEIRVWVKCRCAAADPDDMDDATVKWAGMEYDPLGTFAHELGHFRQWTRDRHKYGNEALADRYGRRLLRSVA